MRIFPIVLLVALFLPAYGSAADMLALPASFKAGNMVRVEEPKSWTSDTMYEHVNGEAELLKRYGATELAYTAYENKDGDYLSVDILNMTAPVNAFGLYSLYAGCDGKEYGVSGATVLSGDFTSYAIYGRYFMRIDFETEGGKEGGKSLVSTFLSALVNDLPETESLPSAVLHLKRLAGKPCEVGYHPEHVDYDLESGPGYIWTSPEGVTCYLRAYLSLKAAASGAADLKEKGIPVVHVRENVVAWSKAGTQEARSYLDRVVSEAVKW